MTTPRPLPCLDTRPVAAEAATVQGPDWRITVLTDGLVRLEHADDGVFEDRASTFAIVRDLPVPDFTVTRVGDGVEVVTDRFRLSYDGRPFSTSGLSLQVRGDVSNYHSVWRHGQPTRDLRGTARTLDEADGRIPLEPGVVSRWGFSLIDDSSSMLLADDGWVAPRDGSRDDLYVFAYGLDHRGALDAFHAVSGLPPLLPRFALGNWWSRYHAYTEAEYRELIGRFEAEGLPFSVSVVDMDWHLVDVDPVHGSGWTGYTWNRELFPDPEEFLAFLHARGLRVTLNVHPADGVRSYEDAYAAMCEALGRDAASGEPIAFDVTDREFLAAFFDVLHRRLEDEGVDFWWIDWQSGPYSKVPGIDPLWVLNHFHFLDSARDGRRPLTFSRYAGPGSHRYPVGFSGDTVVSWESLDFQPEFTATATNIGYGWWSHDVGGHFHGYKDDELAARWVQLGVFSPVLRLHSGSNPFNTKEPWRFGPVAREAMSQALRLRHRLVPYLHTMNHRAAGQGRAIVEPMYHLHPAVDAAYEVPNQFAFGTELLVAPITSKHDVRTQTGSVRAWLPSGTWVDVLGGQVYDGDREVVLHRGPDAIPVLAAPGAIVPLDGAGSPGNGTDNPASFEVLVVVGADGAFELVEDDGRTPAQRLLTPISLDQKSGVLSVGPSTGDRSCAPSERGWTVTFLRLDAAVEPVVEVDGAGVDAVVAHHARGTSVEVGPVASDAAFTVRLGPDPSLGEDDVAARLFGLLDRAQIEFDLKEQVRAVATSDLPLATRVATLSAMDLGRALETAVLEVVTARTV
ncbi:TIM-barrel domain-containing protein [Solicola sp. PLA-1-18]|uniref:glycoside hydrolase family 31 protein n=1 Tax=Solicola sp. PLA-1-18 TaxID=3380532 RepID=UPI003B796C24